MSKTAKKSKKNLKGNTKKKRKNLKQPQNLLEKNKLQRTHETYKMAVFIVIVLHLNVSCACNNLSKKKIFNGK